MKLNSREKKLKTRDFSGTLHGAKRERPNLFKGRRPYRLKIRLKTLRRYLLLLVSPSVYFFKMYVAVIVEHFSQLLVSLFKKIQKWKFDKKKRRKKNVDSIVKIAKFNGNSSFQIALYLFDKTDGGTRLIARKYARQKDDL